MATFLSKDGKFFVKDGKVLQYVPSELERTWVFNTRITVPPTDYEVKFTNVDWSTIIEDTDPDEETTVFTGLGIYYDSTNNKLTYKIDNEHSIITTLVYDYTNNEYNSEARAIIFDELLTRTSDNATWYDWFVQNAIQLPAKGKTLNEYTWQEISAISAANKAEEYGFKPGDTKQIHLEGTVGTLAVNNDYNVYILGINHNVVPELPPGITFGTFKTSDGIDVCLADNDYGNSSNNTAKADIIFSMNQSNTNVGGWKNSFIRYSILGSTNVENDNATADCAITPVANTLMAALPSDLRTVLRAMTVYSDNTGGGTDTESNVTSTKDYLPLLAEYEIRGTRGSANSAEQNYQKQYDYYKNNSLIKYLTSKTSQAALWWLRSVYSSNTSAFLDVMQGGSVAGFSGAAYYSYGIAPIFRV